MLDWNIAPLEGPKEQDVARDTFESNAQAIHKDNGIERMIASKKVSRHGDPVQAMIVARQDEYC